jgi:hypothetical protein
VTADQGPTFDQRNGSLTHSPSGDDQLTRSRFQRSGRHSPSRHGLHRVTSGVGRERFLPWWRTVDNPQVSSDIRN